MFQLGIFVVCYSQYDKGESAYYRLIFPLLMF